MFQEADLLPISGLAQLCYCERRWALIHIEGLWSDNTFTAEGRVLHEKVHSELGEMRAGVKLVRGLPLRSLRLGLFGVADLVEFRAPPEPPFPVEFKRGRPKPERSDEVQLCAQAMCLEEMLQLCIPRGALFYARVRRRCVVEFGEDLRSVVRTLAARMHELFASGVTPPPRDLSKCRHCSLKESCLPQVASQPGKAARWLQRARQAAAEWDLP